MKEARGDLWDYPADVVVITTNGTIKSNGACVMGRGCALEATKLFPGIARALGRQIAEHGNHAGRIPMYNIGRKLVSFPVKHAWYEKASIELIERSARELVELADLWKGCSFVMPRPGCGNGHLDWADVRPVIEPILDDRFTVITF